MNRPRLIPLTACVLALGHAASACAQSAFTVYGGYRGGSGFRSSDAAGTPLDMRSNGAISAAIDWPLDASRQLQLFASHQSTRLDVRNAAGTGAPSEMPLKLTYLHLGGTNYFEGGVADGRQGTVGRGPYVAGGLGITVLSPRLEGTSSRVRASMNVGIGYQWPLTQQLSLRTELRGYATLIRSNGSFFCSGGCVVTIKGDTLTQVEGLVGLTFGF